MARKCCYHPRLACFHHGHCGFIDSIGNVSVCRVHPNPDGFFLPRKSLGFHPSFSELLAGVGVR